MKFRITILMAMLLLLTKTALAESMTDEFSAKFSDYEAVNNVSYASSLDEETRNKYQIPESNVVGKDAEGNVYRAHMANNSYVWDKMPDGSYEKSYGGIEGFYGYFHHNNTVETYPVTSNTIEKDSVSILNMAGNVLQISALGNSGYNLYGSFGKYDLNLGGCFVFKTTIAKMGVNNGKSTVTMSLVQNKASDSDKGTGEYHFLKIDTGYGVYFDGATEPCGTIKRGESFNAIPQFYDVEYYMDNTGEKPRHALVIKEEGTDTVVASVGMTEIKDNNSSYDFSEAMGGIRVKNEGSNEWSGNARLLFKNMSFAQIQPLTAQTEPDYYINSPLKPNSENELIEIEFNKKITKDSLTAENIKLIDEKGKEIGISINPESSQTLRIVPASLEGTRIYTLKLTGLMSEDFSVAPDLTYIIPVMDYIEIENGAKTLDKENKTTNISFQVKNNSQSDELCYIFVAAMDKDMKPRQGSVYFKSILLDASKSTDVSITQIPYVSEDDIYSVYIWRNLTEMTALGKNAVIK